MVHWRAELDALVTETMAFAKSINAEAERSVPPPPERIALTPLDYGGSEREEILTRVEAFKAHQQRLIREREEYAVSLLRNIKP